MPREKRDPNYRYIRKTAVFQLHNPSGKKRRILRDVLRRNHLAYSKLLAAALGELESIAKASGDSVYRTNKARIGKVKKLIQKQVVSFPLAKASKDGVQEDVAYQIAAYLALLDKYEKDCKAELKKPKDKRKQISKPGAPTFARLTPFEEAHAQAYEDLRDSLTVEAENKARDDIAREAKAGLTRPLLFTRYDIHGGFIICFDKVKDRYLIFLNLYSAKSRHAKKVEGKLVGADLRGLIDIRTGKEPKTKTSRTGLLFPIEFGKDFQFQDFLDSDGHFEKFGRYVESVTAKLVERRIPRKKPLKKAKKSVAPELAEQGIEDEKRRNEAEESRFEVHVAFEFKTPKIEPTSLLGVDRGIYNLASMCVIDERGGVVVEKNYTGRDLRYVQQQEERRQRKTQKRGKKYKAHTRRAEADRAAHTAANAIVEMAQQHQSQVVLENLSNLSGNRGKRGRSNFNRLLTRAQYAKLQHILEYKLPLVGLPPPISVAAQGTSQTCPECGNWDAKNREKNPLPDQKGFAMDKFLCLKCGYTHDADLNAARVIALKKKWRLELPKSQQAKMAKILDDTKFSFAGCLTLWREQRDQQGNRR